MLKALGFALVLLGGFGLRGSLLAGRREEIRLGEELCAGLDRLEQGIFRLRLPLGEILRACERESRASRALWQTLRRGLEGEEEFVRVWRESVGALPDPYGEQLLPLGGALTAGERRDLLLLTREEVHRAVEEKRRRRAEEDRLVTALCLSAAGLLAVVLL